MAVSSAGDYSISFQVCAVISCLSMWQRRFMAKAQPLCDSKEGVSSQEGQ